MRKLVSVVVLVAAAAVGCGTAAATTNPVPSQVHTQRIEEDDPRWDCRTMGNHVCGDNATALLPHQDVPGFYSWDGDEWMFNPAAGHYSVDPDRGGCGLEPRARW